MRLNQFDKEEYRDILMFEIEENNNEGYLFNVYKLYSSFNTEHKLHRHKYFQINYVLEGKLSHRLNNNKFDLIKGDIFVIPPYIPHSTAEYDNIYCEIIELEFTSEFINQSFGNMENVEYFMDFMYIESFLISENQVKPRLNLCGKAQTKGVEIYRRTLCRKNTHGRCC